MGPVVTDGSTARSVICHLPTPALPGQVRTVDGPEPSSQRTGRALPRVFSWVSPTLAQGRRDWQPGSTEPGAIFALVLAGAAAEWDDSTRANVWRERRT